MEPQVNDPLGSLDHPSEDGGSGVLIEILGVVLARSGAVYQAYRSYCADTGEFFRSTAEFYAALEMGFS